MLDVLPTELFDIVVNYLSPRHVDVDPYYGHIPREFRHTPIYFHDLKNIKQTCQRTYYLLGPSQYLRYLYDFERALWAKHGLLHDRSIRIPFLRGYYIRSRHDYICTDVEGLDCQDISLQYRLGAPVCAWYEAGETSMGTSRARKTSIRDFIDAGIRHNDCTLCGTNESVFKTRSNKRQTNYRSRDTTNVPTTSLEVAGTVPVYSWFEVAAGLQPAARAVFLAMLQELRSK